MESQQLLTPTHDRKASSPGLPLTNQKSTYLTIFLELYTSRRAGRVIIRDRRPSFTGRTYCEEPTVRGHSYPETFPALACAITYWENAPASRCRSTTFSWGGSCLTTKHLFLLHQQREWSWRKSFIITPTTQPMRHRNRRQSINPQQTFGRHAALPVN